MNFEDFKDPELQEKLRNAESPPGAAGPRQGEQLEAVSGGNWSCWDIVGCTDICEKYDAEWMHECWRYKRPQGPVPCSIH